MLVTTVFGLFGPRHSTDALTQYSLLAAQHNQALPEGKKKEHDGHL